MVLLCSGSIRRCLPPCTQYLYVWIALPPVVTTPLFAALPRPLLPLSDAGVCCCWAALPCCCLHNHWRGQPAGHYCSWHSHGQVGWVEAGCLVLVGGSPFVPCATWIPHVLVFVFPLPLWGALQQCTATFHTHNSQVNTSTCTNVLAFAMLSLACSFLSPYAFCTPPSFCPTLKPFNPAHSFLYPCAALSGLAASHCCC